MSTLPSRVPRTGITKILLCAALPLLLLSLSPISHSAIETISVTGTRLALDQTQFAGQISALDADDIANSNAQFLSELLPRLTGVDVAVNGSVGQFAELRIRGGETNHVVVLLDGVQINDNAQGGLIDLAHISTDNIARIELLHGAGSAQWGDGAIAGVISITTKQAKKNALDLSLKVGEKDTLAVALNGAYVRENQRHHLSFSRYSTDGQNISSKPDDKEKDGYQNLQAMLNSAWTLSADTSLTSTLRLTQYETDYDAIDFVETGKPKDALNVSDGEKITASLNVKHALSTQKTLTATLQYHSDKVDNIESGTLASASQTDEMRVIATYAHRDDSLQWLVGSQFNQVDFEQAGPVGFGDPNQQQTTEASSVFVDSAYQVQPDLWLNANARYTDNTEFDSAVDYRVGASWQVAPQLRLFANTGQASKNPTFTERFGFFPASFIGNPDLEPEKAITQEVGLAYTLKNGRWDIALFDTQLENEINGFAFDAVNNGFTAVNIAGKSQRQGMNWQGQWQFSRWDLALQYSYTDATADDASVELRRARHNGSISADILLNASFDLHLNASYHGTQFDQFFPPFPEPSSIVQLSAYWLMGAKLDYTINNKQSLSLSVDNLFDKAYQDIFGYKGGKRKVSLKYKHKW